MDESPISTNDLSKTIPYESEVMELEEINQALLQIYRLVQHERFVKKIKHIFTTR